MLDSSESVSSTGSTSSSSSKLRTAGRLLAPRASLGGRLTTESLNSSTTSTKPSSRTAAISAGRPSLSRLTGPLLRESSLKKKQPSSPLHSPVASTSASASTECASASDDATSSDNNTEDKSTTVKTTATTATAPKTSTKTSTSRLSIIPGLRKPSISASSSSSSSASSSSSSSSATAPTSARSTSSAATSSSSRLISASPGRPSLSARPSLNSSTTASRLNESLTRSTAVSKTNTSTTATTSSNSSSSSLNSSRTISAGNKSSVAALSSEANKTTVVRRKDAAASVTSPTNAITSPTANQDQHLRSLPRDGSPAAAAAAAANVSVIVPTVKGIPRSSSSESLSSIGSFCSLASHRSNHSGSESSRGKSSNISVLCRFRPQNSIEIKNGGHICVNFRPDGKSLEITDPMHTAVSTPRSRVVNNNTSANASIISSTTSSSSASSDFTFDRVWDMQATQQQIFDHIGPMLIGEVLEGYNATLFAYGQTGAGKTYTMMGSLFEDDVMDPNDSRNGVSPRLVWALFDAIEVSDPNIVFTVKVSYLEIYMEQVNDLLNPSNKNLQIKEGAGRGSTYVEGATEVYVSSPEEVFVLMKSGNAKRKTAATGMNKESSRSHSIFLMQIGQMNGPEQRNSKLYLVDLAGSEKIAKTSVQGTQLEEAKMINLSLTTLGKVINALTDGKSTHIPYRESKLTRLLQDSIGGNSRTALLINCSPSTYNYDETLSTLRFGTRAKHIKNKPVINKQYTVDELLVQLKKKEEEISKLQLRNAALEAEILMGGMKRVAKINSEAAAAAAAAAASEENASATEGGGVEETGEGAVASAPGAPGTIAAAAVASSGSTMKVPVPAILFGDGGDFSSPSSSSPSTVMMSPEEMVELFMKKMNLLMTELDKKTSSIMQMEEDIVSLQMDIEAYICRSQELEAENSTLREELTLLRYRVNGKARHNFPSSTPTRTATSPSETTTDTETTTATTTTTTTGTPNSNNNNEDESHLMQDLLPLTEGDSSDDLLGGNSVDRHNLSFGSPASPPAALSAVRERGGGRFSLLDERILTDDDDDDEKFNAVTDDLLWLEEQQKLLLEQYNTTPDRNSMSISSPTGKRRSSKFIVPIKRRSMTVSMSPSHSVAVPTTPTTTDTDTAVADTAPAEETTAPAAAAAIENEGTERGQS